MELQSFLESVVQHPHNDQPRLVLADYLEERGDPRAELIRLQFRTADLSKRDPSYPQLRRRELALLRKLGPFATPREECKVLGYRGGFVDHIQLTITRFLKWQDELFAELPVRYVTFTGRSSQFDRLAESAHLPELAGVRFHKNEAGLDGMPQLIGKVAWKRLESLEVADHTDGFLFRKIASSQAKGTLRRLRVSGHIATLEAADILSSARDLQRLEDLALPFASDGCAIKIAKANWNLKSLALDGYFSAPTLDAVHRGSGCQSLRELELFGRAYTDDLADGIPATPLPHLRSLKIRGAGGSPLVERIVSVYRDLEVLELKRCLIQDDGAIALARSPLLSSLRKISLTNNHYHRLGASRLWHRRHTGAAAPSSISAAIAFHRATSRNCANTARRSATFRSNRRLIVRELVSERTDRYAKALGQKNWGQNNFV